jgi:hypothetical protein
MNASSGTALIAHQWKNFGWLPCEVDANGRRGRRDPEPQENNLTVSIELHVGRHGPGTRDVRYRGPAARRLNFFQIGRSAILKSLR